MENKINLENFRFEVVNARETAPQKKNIIDAAYELWNSVWTEALVELEGAANLRSDDFSRQEQVGVLFYQDEAVGTLFFSRADLRSPMWRKDSYFTPWPEDLMKRMGEAHPNFRMLICSYFTLGPNWRRSAPGFSAKRLLTSLAVEQLNSSGCDVMLGTMRVNRGMHSICYEVGAQPLCTGLQHHGVEVDLIVFDKKHIQDTQAAGPMTALAKDIYSRSVGSNVVPIQPPIAAELPAKRSA